MRKAFLLLILVAMSLACFISCDDSGKDPFVPPEDVDGVQSITVQGHVELFMRGKVLIPNGFKAELKENSTSAGSFHAEHYHASTNFRWATELTCVLSDPNYTYSFSTRYDAENKKTVVYLDIDRDIENPAYIQIDHIECEDVPEDTSFTVWFESGKTVLNPAASGIERWLGAYTFVNGVDSYTIKVDPDAYRWHEYDSNSADYPVGEYVQDTDDFELKAGETYVFDLRRGSALLVVQFKDFEKYNETLGCDIILGGQYIKRFLNTKNHYEDPVSIANFIGKEMTVELKPIFVGNPTHEYQVTPSSIHVEKDKMYVITVSPK